MKNDRLRSPVRGDYTVALGQAGFSFATCEWNVAWCCERISPGSLERISADRLTAGGIATKFRNLVRNMPPSDERATLARLATEFAEVVELRNRIVHGAPCTGPNGEARLSNGAVFEISDLEDAADRFEACSIELNGMLHGFLSSYAAIDHGDGGLSDTENHDTP